MHSYLVTKGHDSASVVMACDLVGRTGFEPVTFRVREFQEALMLSRLRAYVRLMVHARPLESAAVSADRYSVGYSPGVDRPLIRRSFRSPRYLRLSCRAWPGS
jgi:hypothetical protein